MTLTHNNYFTKDNKYLSNSKINDWNICKNYFYRKHITGELVEEKTDAMLVGSAVDNILTDLNNFQNGKYAVRQFNGTTKEGKAETLELKEQGLTILTQAKYDDIMGMAVAVSETTAYKELKDHTAQEILQVDMLIGDHFLGLCGVPDWFKIDGDTCIITDLKTAKTVDDKRYYYHAREYGYMRQMAFYSLMLATLYPDIKSFVYRHIVVNKHRNVWLVKSFDFEPREIDNERLKLIKAIDDISNEKEFKKQDATWENATRLVDPNSVELV